MFGRMMNDTLGKLHFWFTFITYYGTFFPMHYIGIAGHMRRIYDPYQYEFLKHLQPINQFITISAHHPGRLADPLLRELLLERVQGQEGDREPVERERAGVDDARPPPPHGNWPGEIPEVHRWPYEYSNPGAPKDYVMQTSPRWPAKRAH